jgi:hypothetical protein
MQTQKYRQTDRQSIHTQRHIETPTHRHRHRHMHTHTHTHEPTKGNKVSVDLRAQVGDKTVALFSHTIVVRHYCDAKFEGVVHHRTNVIL